MEHITAAGNLAVPAYLALLPEGFRVRRKATEYGEDWIAERADRRGGSCQWER